MLSAGETSYLEQYTFLKNIIISSIQDILGQVFSHDIPDRAYLSPLAKDLIFSNDAVLKLNYQPLKSVDKNFRYHALV